MDLREYEGTWLLPNGDFGEVYVRDADTLYVINRIKNVWSEIRIDLELLTLFDSDMDYIRHELADATLFMDAFFVDNSRN